MDENIPTEKSGLNYTVIGAAILILVILGGAFLVLGKKAEERLEGKRDDSRVMQQSSPTAVPSPKESMTASPSASATVKMFTLATGSFYFKPNQITVKKGDTVKVSVTNEDAMGHNFSIDAFNVSVPLPAGKTTDVTFTADKSGTFTFYCSIGSHASRGQKGTLIVQ